MSGIEGGGRASDEGKSGLAVVRDGSGLAAVRDGSGGRGRERNAGKSSIAAERETEER